MHFAMKYQLLFRRNHLMLPADKSQLANAIWTLAGNGTESLSSNEAFLSQKSCLSSTKMDQRINI